MINTNIISELLFALGVTASTLSAAQKTQLDTQGYLVLPRLIEEEWLEQLREVFERLVEEEGEQAGKEVFQEKGTRRLADLVNKSPVFDPVYTHPLVLAAVYHVLKRPFKLHSLNARDALPGYGLQPLHTDWEKGNEKERYNLVNSIWLLDDFTPLNGATRLVPGSHRLAGKPADYLADTLATHPDKIGWFAPAGSVMVFNAHVWHGGTLNQSNEIRRGLHCAFVGRELKQQTDQRKYIRSETLARISTLAKYLLDVA